LCASTLWLKEQLLRGKDMPAANGAAKDEHGKRQNRQV
jgi:hypothetical protein